VEPDRNQRRTSDAYSDAHTDSNADANTNTNANTNAYTITNADTVVNANADAVARSFITVRRKHEPRSRTRLRYLVARSVPGFHDS
jgi:hypothetical protein